MDQPKYVKLVAAPGTGHKYEIELYTSCGKLLDTKHINLADLDKKTGKTKLRIRKNNVWAVIAGDSYIAIGLPQFLKE